MQMNCSVEICEHKILKGLVNSYVVYRVNGIANDVFRRYSDFERLRDLLRHKYPGILLPMLPPKFLYKNYEQNRIA